MPAMKNVNYLFTLVYREANKKKGFTETEEHIVATSWNAARDYWSRDATGPLIREECEIITMRKQVPIVAILP